MEDLKTRGLARSIKWILIQYASSRCRRSLVHRYRWFVNYTEFQRNMYSSGNWEKRFPNVAYCNAAAEMVSPTKCWESVRARALQGRKSKCSISPLTFTVGEVRLFSHPQLLTGGASIESETIEAQMNLLCTEYFLYIYIDSCSI